MRRTRSAIVPVVLLALLASLLAAPPSALAKKKKKPAPTPQAAAGSKQPDKELYDKAMANMKHNHLDEARLQLQALLNTYPESEYQMKAKLAIGDTWYKGGDAASLTQAENEYKDFITFFPTAPEAADAQMRVADIYFKQMDKPDRDYQKALRAEQEYRILIQQFPDSPLVPRAKQKLREVQEVLAERQFLIGQFYTTRFNWPATIARYQTVIDAYPLYSKADLTLLGLGDAYQAQAARIRTMKGPEAIKSKMIKVYEDHAATDYDRILTRYPLEPRAADARQRLAAMHREIPKPTSAELAENQAEIESRAPVTLRSRALLLVSHKPEVLEAARVGEPDMETPKPTIAPEITKQNIAIYNEIAHPGSAPASVDAASPSATPAATTTAGDTTAPPRSDEAPTLENVPSSDDTVPAATAPSSGASTTMGIVSTGGMPVSTDGSNAHGSEPASASVVTQPKGAALPSVGPRSTTLPPTEKPAEAPDQVNEVKSQGGAPVQTVSGKKKPKKPAKDKSDESSSKDKKKKGLDKLNPF
jgi:outer membrane protein assembly factor BamD